MTEEKIMEAVYNPEKTDAEILTLFWYNYLDLTTGTMLAFAQWFENSDNPLIEKVWAKFLDDETTYREFEDLLLSVIDELERTA